MKKLILIIAIVLVLVLGWFVFFGSKDAVSPTTSSDNKQITTQDSGALPVAEKNSVISSIKDAMGLGKKMKCTYSAATATNGDSSTVFIDGQKYKFTSEANGEKISGIFDGETQYMWTMGATKQGFTMTKACIEELGKARGQTGEDANTPASQNIADFFDDAKNIVCEVSEGEDFSIPTDITFIDQCEMMKNSLKTLEGIKGQLPTDVNIPGY